MLWKYCTQHASKFGKLSNGHRTGKGQFSFQPQRRAMTKNAQTTALISHESKVMLKILQASLQQYVNQELPDVQFRFRKERGTRHQMESQKKQRDSRKNIYFCFIDYDKAFDCVDHKKTVENSSKDGNNRPLYHLLRNLCAGQEAIVKQTWNNRQVQNWERSTSRLYIVTLLI